MSKSAFAKAIISKMKTAISTDGQSYGDDTASSAMSAVAEAITEYLNSGNNIGTGEIYTDADFVW